MKHTFIIVGMHCGSCVANVKKALLQHPDIKSAEVTLDPPKAEIEMQNHINTDELRKIVEQSGEFFLKEVNE